MRMLYFAGESGSMHGFGACKRDLLARDRVCADPELAVEWLESKGRHRTVKATEDQQMLKTEHSF